MEHYCYRTREDGVKVPVVLILPSEDLVPECLLSAASLALGLVHRVDQRFTIGRAAEWDELALQVNARYAVVRVAAATNANEAVNAASKWRFSKYKEPNE
jgi:hypothetical protein